MKRQLYNSVNSKSRFQLGAMTSDRKKLFATAWPHNLFLGLQEEGEASSSDEDEGTR